MKKKRITKGEKLLYSLDFLCAILTFVMEIFLRAQIGHLGLGVEKLKYKVHTQTNTNETLAMKVNELTSFTKVNEVVKNMGLVYNYENIINIDK
jgi:cell division protein FtsL